MSSPASPSPEEDIPGRPYWDGVGAAWAEGRRHRLWRQHGDAVNGRLVRRWLPTSPDRVLKTDLFDEAVGGGLLDAIASSGDGPVGVDLSPRVARAARSGRGVPLAVAADVRKLPFPPDSFDTIVSISTLDHFPDREEIGVALAELARVLAPGGRLILTLDNPWNPAVALRNSFPGAWLRAVGLVPYYVGATLGPRQARAALGRVGLEVVEIEAVLHVPRAPAVALASVLEKRAGARAAQAFLRITGAFEALARWPTRFLTGHYVAALAVGPKG